MDLWVTVLFLLVRVRLSLCVEIYDSSCEPVEDRELYLDTLVTGPTMADVGASNSSDELTGDDVLQVPIGGDIRLLICSFCEIILR